MRAALTAAPRSRNCSRAKSKTQTSGFSTRPPSRRSITTRRRRSKGPPISEACSAKCRSTRSPLQETNSISPRPSVRKKSISKSRTRPRRWSGTPLRTPPPSRSLSRPRRAARMTITASLTTKRAKSSPLKPARSRTKAPCGAATIAHPARAVRVDADTDGATDGAGLAKTALAPQVAPETVPRGCATGAAVTGVTPRRPPISLPLAICSSPARNFLCRSQRNPSRRKVHASPRTSRCLDVSLSSCPRLTTWVCRAKSNPTVSGAG